MSNWTNNIIAGFILVSRLPLPSNTSPYTSTYTCTYTHANNAN